MLIRVCSGWSLGFGLIRPETALDWAVRAGIRQLCLADFDNLYGAIEFYQLARDRGIQPILGAIVTDRPCRSAEAAATGDLSRDRDKKLHQTRVPRSGRRPGRARLHAAYGRPGKPDRATPWHVASDGYARAGLPCEPDHEHRPGMLHNTTGSSRTGPAETSNRQVDPALLGTRVVVSRFDAPKIVAIACDLAGYENLCRLLTARHLAERFDLVAAAAEHQEGLIFLVDDPAMLRRLSRRIEPARLFAEICDYGDPASRTRNYRLLNIAEQRNVEPLATHVAYFPGPADWHVHRVLRAVYRNELLGAIHPAQVAPKEAWLQPADRIRARLRHYPRALRNARRLAERCNLQLELDVPHFPKADVPAGETSDSYLSKLARAGLAERYGRIPPEAASRLQRELAVIRKLGFSDYFLVVHEIVHYARRNGICYVGRGSAADSLVTYCLGISAVDPLRYNLNFERFLNESRTDLPDVDVDFDWRHRDEVIEFIYRRWGPSRVAMITTQHFYKARSAFRDVARALGMPAERVDRLAGRLPYDEPGNLRRAIATLPECRNFPLHDPRVAEAVQIAERFTGLPRGLSVHVGGVVIADREITCYTPLQPAAKGIAVTQYDMHAIERVGLIKIDILSHRSLAVLADTVKLLQRNYGLKVDLDAVPEDDPATAALLAAGRTIGCFQIESPGMRQLLQMLQAGNQMDVIHGLALIRPGPSASGMKEHFVRRKRGLEKPTYLHPAMKEVLAETYGVMLFQEDVMRVAAAVAGLTMATGDQLRKALEKPDRKEHLEKLKQQFLQGARKRRCDRATAEKIWTMVSNFAAYAYNKAHACTYGRIGYLCTYLKAHWPAEFLTAALNNIGGYYSLSEYLEEARRLGIHILPPHVNRSELHFTAEPIAVQQTPADRRDPKAKEPPNTEARRQSKPAQADSARQGPGGLVLRRVGIRVGLLQVKNLSLRSARQIVQQRKDRPFLNLADLLERASLSIEEARSLILSGACDGLGPSRPAMLWQLAIWHRRRNAPRRDPVENEPSLFSTLERTEDRASQQPNHPSEWHDPQREDRPDTRDPIAPRRRKGRDAEFPAERQITKAMIRSPRHSPSRPTRQGLPTRAARSSPLETHTLPDWLFQDYDRATLLRLERQYLDLSPSDHPLARWEDRLARYSIVRSVDLPHFAGKTVTVAGIIVASRRAVTKAGRLMRFVTLEDRWGLIEVVLFPEIYQRFGGRFGSLGPYLVRGTVQENLDAVALTCESVSLLAEVPPEKILPPTQAEPPRRVLPDR